MPKFYDHIPADIGTWAMSQPVFFTASAPLAGKHINVSPKGLPASTFTILSPHQAAYLDATGSGCETISHVYENGRLTIMFCSFDRSPRILRFFCTAHVLEWDSPAFDATLARMAKPRLTGARAIILLDVFKVQTSCGYGVPLLSPKDAVSVDVERATSLFVDRAQLGHWATQKVDKNEIDSYRVQWNTSSLDRLPGLHSARRDKGERLWLTDTAATLRRCAAQRDAVLFGVFISILMYLLVNLLQRVITTR